MRIISDFKDYYDSALSFGSDPNLTYLRRTEEFEFEARFAEAKNRMPRNLDQALRVPLGLLRQLPHSILGRVKFPVRWIEMPVTAKIVGFCGFLHAAIEIDHTICHAVDHIAGHLSNDFLRPFGVDQESLAALLRRHYPDVWRERHTPLTSDFWEKSVAEFAGKRFDDVFVEAGVPAFKLEYTATNKRGVADTIRCTLNPYLRAEGFQKIRPPAEAFQDISMYLGNQLARQLDPMPAFPDEIMRDEKGFDEWSFRRHKEEGKKYRKKDSED